MTTLIFAAVDPTLAAVGQIAALVICLFAVVFVLISVVFHLAMSFAMSWLSEKAELIKMFRPYVTSINTSSKAAEQGIAPSEDERPIARAVAQVPLKLYAADKKVEQVSDRVANAVIEFRSRTLQVQMIAKSFFLPGLTHREPATPSSDNGLQFGSPGYRALMKERPGIIPGQPAEQKTAEQKIPVVPQAQVMPGQR